MKKKTTIKDLEKRIKVLEKNANILKGENKMKYSVRITRDTDLDIWREFNTLEEAMNLINKYKKRHYCLLSIPYSKEVKDELIYNQYTLPYTVQTSYKDGWRCGQLEETDSIERAQKLKKRNKTRYTNVNIWCNIKQFVPSFWKKLK